MDNNLNFQSPYSPQIQDISQQRKFADLLRQQSTQELKGQMIGDRYVAPSWTQQLAKVIQGGLADYNDSQASQSTRDLSDKYQNDMSTANQNLSDSIKSSKEDPDAIAKATSDYFTATGNPEDAGKFALSNAQDNIKRARTAQLLQSYGLGTPSSTLQSNADGSTAAPTQSTFGGVNGLAAALTLSGDPSLGKLGEMVQKSNEPLINRGYGINKLNPATGNYELDAGSLAGINAVEQAKANVSANHDIVGIPQSDGTTRYMTKAQQIQQVQPAQNMPVNTQNQNNSSVMNQFTPREQSAIQQDAAKNNYSNYDVNYKQNNGQSNTATIGNYPTGQQSTGLTGGQTTMGKEMQMEQGKTAGEMEAKINNDANSAVAKIAQNNKMVSLIPEITTGPLSKQITTLKTLGQTLGINIGDPSNNQEFEKYAIKGALEGAKQIYGARLTNQDVQSQIMSNPGSNMSEKALYQLIKYDTIVQQRNLDKQKSYFEYQSDGKPLNQFEMHFNQSNPFMGVGAPNQGQSAQESAPAAQQSIAKAKSGNAKLKANPDGSFTYGGH